MQILLIIMLSCIKYICVRDLASFLSTIQSIIRFCFFFSRTDVMIWHKNSLVKYVFQFLHGIIMKYEICYENEEELYTCETPFFLFYFASQIYNIKIYNKHIITLCDMFMNVGDATTTNIFFVHFLNENKSKN